MLKFQLESNQMMESAKANSQQIDELHNWLNKALVTIRQQEERIHELEKALGLVIEPLGDY